MIFSTLIKIYTDINFSLPLDVAVDISVSVVSLAGSSEHTLNDMGGRPHFSRDLPYLHDPLTKTTFINRPRKKEGTNSSLHTKTVAHLTLLHGIPRQIR